MIRSLHALLRPFDDRLNPILVKEVRQALRGRYFSVVFWIMLALATVIGCVLLVVQGMDPEGDAGVTFFIAMYGCLSVAVHVFVPFSAFLSVGAEWEENTFDLLVLSDLKPRQIVLGKLLSAGIQVLLFYSAFGPFLVFAFLLHGLDFVGAMWVLGLTLISSAALTCVALCLSSLVRKRFGRVFVMAALAGLLVWVTGGSIAFAATLFAERFIHTPEFLQAAGGGVTGAVVVAAFAMALAATRFAHEEENRSTALRVLTLATVLAALGWGAYLQAAFGVPEVPWVLAILTVLGVTVLSVLYCTEHERLGRRVRHQVPGGWLPRLLLAPLLPGGGRGVLFFWSCLGILALGLLGLEAYRRSTSAIASAPAQEVSGVLLGVTGYAALYLHLVSGLFARWSDSVRLRILARFAVPVVVVLSVTLPMVLGFLVQHRDLSRGRHLGNPVWAIGQAIEEGNTTPLLMVWIAVGGVVLLNLPRTLRGLAELLRLEREASGDVSVSDGTLPES